MKNNTLNQAIILTLVIFNMSFLYPAYQIDVDINAKSGLALKQYAQTLKDRAITLSSLGEENVLLGKCLHAAKSTDPIEAFTPFFDCQKTKAKENFASFIVTSVRD